MAFAGAMIVFSGLLILVLAISQLHKLLNLFEKNKAAAPGDLTATPAEIETVPVPFGDLTVLFDQYGPLAAELGETFQLSDLFEMAQAKGLPHIHYSIKTLREGLYLLPQGDGNFRWRSAGND
jgi:hypothetical protein